MSRIDGKRMDITFKSKSDALRALLDLDNPGDYDVVFSS